ncbi:ThiF family adenylyltransferase [Candidatus Micrarchaeota archaeon]|nr:ThiF family adenylyltransferase [Candidatus Micrarchaeota archaeon]
MSEIIDADQWDRQKRIRGWDQSAIENSRCLVVGAGALGNEVVKNLLQLGVAEIVVVDYDRVVAANLNRCVLFTPQDALDGGQFKARAVARGAKGINPTARVAAVVKRAEELPEGLFLNFDFCFSCLDNLGARLHLNAHCYGKCALIDGGTFGFNGKVQVVKGGSACLECGVSRRDYAAMWDRYSCTGEKLEFLDPKFPAIATATSFTAAVQANEFVKIAMKSNLPEEMNPLNGRPLSSRKERKFEALEDNLVGKYLFFNGLTNSASVFEVPKRPKCPVHG